MSERVVVDASVWVSSYTKEDANHIASRLWIGRYAASNGLIAAPAIISIEIAAAVSRRIGDATLAKQAVKNLKESAAMSTLTILAMDPNFVDAAATIAADLRLRAGDAIYVALAQQLNIPLVSWDKEQLQKASSLIPVYTPDSYPFTTTNNPNEI